MTDQTEYTEDEWGSLAVSEEDGIEVIKKSYGWTIAVDGTVAGLVAGDQGYDLTHITIPREDIAALVEDWPEFYHDAKDKRIEELEAALSDAAEALELANSLLRQKPVSYPIPLTNQFNARHAAAERARTTLAELKGTD